MNFQIFKGKNGKWFWRAVAGNGHIVADGSQGYATKYVCRDRLRSFVSKTAIAAAAHAPIEVI